MLLYALAANPCTSPAALAQLAELALERDWAGTRVSPPILAAHLLANAALPHECAVALLGRRRWAREVTLPAVMSRAGLTVALAKGYLAAAEGASFEELAYTVRQLPIGTPGGVHVALLRAAAGAHRSPGGPDVNWVALLTNPHAPPSVRLTFLRDLATSPDLRHDAGLDLTFAYALARHPRNVGATLARIVRRSGWEPRRIDALTRFAHLPWHAGAQGRRGDTWAAMFHNADEVTRAKLLGATGDVTLARETLAAGATVGQAQVILTHRHLPLDVLQGAMTVGAGADGESLAATRAVFRASGTAWAAQHLSRTVNPDSLTAYAHVSDLPAAVLAHQLAGTGGRSPRVAAWVATQARTAPAVRARARTIAQGTDFATIAAAGDGLSPRTLADCGGNLPARTGTKLARFSEASSGIPAMRAAYLATVAGHLDTPGFLEVLLGLEPAFAGTLRELFHAAAGVCAPVGATKHPRD